MALGVVTVELTYLAWAKFVFDTMGDRISLWPAAVLASALPCYQALVWSLAGFRITRIIVLALAGMVFLNIAMIPAFPALQPWPLEKTCAVFVWVLAGLGLGAILGGWFAVERQRRGGGRGRGWLQAQWGRMVDALPRRRKEFASKESAQFWYEWRRSGLLLPVCTLAAPVLIFTPVSWFTRHDADETMLTLAWTLALPVILAAIIGQGFSKPEFWSGNISLAPFVAVHPLANGDFVVAKMRVALLSALLAWLPVLIFLALWLPLWANTVELRKWWDAGVILHGSGIMLVILTLLFISAMILTWRGMVGGANCRRWNWYLGRFILWVSFPLEPPRTICLVAAVGTDPGGRDQAMAGGLFLAHDQPNAGRKLRDALGRWHGGPDSAGTPRLSKYFLAQTAGDVGGAVALSIGAPWLRAGLAGPKPS
jgi:hypothetical protein